MKDIRQSPQFAAFMKYLDWEVEKIDSAFVYLKKLPLLGYFAKIPRPDMPVDPEKLVHFKKTKKIFRLKISPFIDDADKKYREYQQQLLNSGFKIDKSPFSPTANYLVSLLPKEEEIFQNFFEAKRRAVRRAMKNGIKVYETSDLDTFVKIRQRQYPAVWFLVGGEMQKLWGKLYPHNATLLLAYEPAGNKAVAGILLLFYGQAAYYWFASSLSVGKKLFAPTLLVWEAIKLAKKKGCKIFDFEGIYDERFPKASSTWRGFTRFKEGFGGKKVLYMENFYL